MLPLAFLWLFVLLIAVGIPVVFALILSPALFYVSGHGEPLYVSMLVRRTIAGVDQFPMMAIPFFILAGNFLTHGGVARRMIRFATTMIGHWHGGLGLAGVMACALFAAISGSSPATVEIGRAHV